MNLHTHIAAQHLSSRSERNTSNLRVTETDVIVK